LLTGPIESALEDLTNHLEQSASLWWPEDRAWCVATEIDFNHTYIGCDKTCRNEILRLLDIEVFEVDPSRPGYEP
jgi:hypothetical protein